MSRRHRINARCHSLGEIRDILDAMKSFAYMESRKLAQFLAAQQQVVSNLTAMAADFGQFYPETFPRTARSQPVYILVGSERGFCGDINQQLLLFFSQLLEGESTAVAPQLIAVGHKLHTLLQDDERVVASIGGASVVEDVPATLQALVERLSALQSLDAGFILYGVYHHSEGQVGCRQFLPPFHAAEPQQGRADPPLLTVSPSQLLLQLTEQYLFAALNEMLYVSLMSENHRRVTHLERAVDHLDDEGEALRRRANTLRQEEITEELEVILLSADSLQQASRKKYPL